MPKDSKNSIRNILLMGVFWRILFIEAVLLVYSLFYSWITEDAGPMDLFWYAVRIIILVAIIILFMMVTLSKFLTQQVITPLEQIAHANEKFQQDDSEASHIELPADAADEFHTIVSYQDSMLKKIIRVSE